MSYELQVSPIGGSTRISTALSIIASNWRITTQFSRQGFHPEAGVTHRFRPLTESEAAMHDAAVSYLSRNFKRVEQHIKESEELTETDADELSIAEFISAAQEYINRCRVATAEIDAGEDAMFGGQEVPPFHEARSLTEAEDMWYSGAVDMLTAVFNYSSSAEQAFMSGLLDKFLEDELEDE